MKKSKSINAEVAFPYIMILPTLSIIFIFLLYPIGNTFYLSTQNHVLTNLKDSGFIGLENFKTLSVDGVFWKSAFNSIIWTFANVGIQVILGLVTALLLNMDFKGRGLFRALMFTPWAVGGILVALIFGFMFNESIGVIGDLLMKLGLVNQKVSWFSSGNSSMLAIIIANTWRGVPFFTVSILSSLQTIPLEVYESADVDGANSWVKFSRITMPLIKDTLILTTLLRTIWTLNVVDLIYGMTNGGPNFSTLTIPVIFCSLTTLFPFYWFLCTSLKPERSIMQLPLEYFPSQITGENYLKITNNFGFSHYFINSLIVSITTTLLIIVIAIMGGYAVSRYKFRGKKGFMLLLLLTQMLPGVVILIPLFSIFNKLGLINNLGSLVITYTAINLPFCLIMMSGFFSSLPPTLEEAAMIDGCSRWRAIFTIIVPAIMPGVVSSGAFAFVNAWNEFIFSLNFINQSSKFTLPIGLSMMKGEFTVNYGGLAAGTIISLVPVLLIFCYIQKYLVKGLAAGAVKG